MPETSPEEQDQCFVNLICRRLDLRQILRKFGSLPFKILVLSNIQNSNESVVIGNQGEMAINMSKKQEEKTIEKVLKLCHTKVCFFCA